MDGLETAQKLFADLGHSFEPASIVHYAEQQAWVVAVDDDAIVTAAYDAESEHMFFETDLGPVPDEAVGRVHELLLRLGSAWRETGGLHGALDGRNHALLMYKQPLGDLDGERLEALVGNLVLHRNMWLELMANAADEAVDDDTLTDIGVPIGGIRV